MTVAHVLKTSLTTALLGVAFTTTAFAQTVTTTPSTSPAVTAATTPQAATTENTALTTLKQKAVAEIDRRMTMLTDLTKRLERINKITAEQKATLTAGIKTAQDNLTTLKSKIEADTDLVTLRSDVQSLKASHNTFQFFVIQIQLVASADTVLTITEKFNAFITTLEQKAQSTNTTIPAVTKAITTMQTKIADAQKQAQDAITLVTDLTPDKFPTNRTQLQRARTMLQTARLDIVAARQSVGTVMQSLSSAQSPSGTVTPSAAVSAAPTGTTLSPTTASPTPSATP